MKTQFLVPLSLLAAAGCSWLPSVGPDYTEPEVEIPACGLPDAGLPTTNRTEVGEYVPAVSNADYRTVVTTNEIAAWWTRFDDAELTNLVASAVAENLSYLMAQERLVASRWELLGSYAAYLPQVRGDASFTRLQQQKHASSRWGSGSDLNRDVFAGGFDATWEIDIFGGSRRATESAKAAAEAAEWSLADAWVSLTAEVGSRYLALRTTQQRIETARTNLVLQTETYEILKSRFDSGIGDELAVNQSKYVVDQTHARIPQLLAEEEALKNALAILAGRMPGTLEDELAPCPGRDWLLPPQKLDTVPLDAVRRRPDVRAAERRFAAQVARVGVAESLWYPKLYLNGSLGLDSIHLDKVFSRDALVGSLGPAVSWPIFQGGNVLAKVKAEEARMNEAAFAYEFAVAVAVGEVRNAYSAYTQEYHRCQALEGAVKAASDAVAISNDLYKNGLKDFTAVIDAQRSLLNLQEELVVSRGQISQNLIALYKALGGGLAALD